MRRHIKRALKILMILLVVVSAIGLTVIRFLLPELQQYQQRIEQELSTALGASVRIGVIGTNMRGFEPELVLTDIAIADGDSGQSAIKLKEVRISINLLTAFGYQDILSAGRVTLVGAELYITRKPDGSVAIKGLKSGDEKPLWLLRGGNFEVIQSQITWHDQMFQSPPRTYNNIDIAISNNYISAQHTIHIQVNPSTEQPSRLRLSMQLTGDIFSASGITGQLYIEGSHLNAKNYINARLPVSWKMASGQGHGKIWGRWHKSKLVSLAGFLKFTDVRLTHPEHQDVAITEVSSGFNWQRQDQTWSLGLSRFTLNDGHKQWPETNFSLLVDKPLTTKAKVGLAISHLEIGKLAKLVGLFSPEDNQYITQIKQFQSRGTLKDVLFFTDTETQTWAINGFIDKLKLQAVADMPGVSNLSGHIKGTNESGRITLMSHDLEFTKPDLFRQPLAISSLQGNIDWRYIEDQWHLISDNLVLDTPVLKTRNRMHLKIPESLNMATAMFDFQSHFVDGDLPALKAYWPVGVLDDDLVGWLDNAYVAGRIPQGDALFYGVLKDFPFNHGDGLFEVQFNVEDVELNYHEDWPNFAGFDAQIRYRNDNMTLFAKDWRLNGAQIVETYAELPSVEHSNHLSVRAKIKGKIQQTLGFLQQTPLKDLIAPVTELINVTGENSIDIDMKIPLIAQASTTVDGVATLSKSQLKILAADIDVKKLAGALSFNEQGVFTKQAITGEALGYPIKFKIAQQNQATLIKVDGRTDFINLQERFPGSWWQLARGQLQYELNIDIPADPVASSRVKLFTNLKEVSLLLPGRLAKTAEQERPLTISVELDNTSLIPVKINYADRLQAALVIDREQQQLHSGALLFGTGKINFPEPGVVKLKINQVKLDLDSWLNIEADSNSENSLFDYLNELDVATDQLIWQKNNLKSASLKFSKNKNLWQGVFTSQFAAGRVSLPTTFSLASTINLDLDYIDLSSLSQINTDRNQDSDDFSQQAKFTINSKKLLWQGSDLGVLQLQTIAESNGARIKKFEINGSGYKLSLQGNWFNRKDRLRTLIKGKLEVEDFGESLQRLKISDKIYGSEAMFNFSLRWPGAPYQFDLATVQGTIESDLKQGRLLAIEPGAARILGVFDLTEWKRRISLDFSDVVAEGLAYNSIKGLLYLDKGNIETNNLIIDGVSAKIEIAGRTGLVDRDYDQIVTVIPKSSAVIPFAGTIAGLLVQTITGSHPDSLTRTQFRVKGSWDKPQVSELHDNDGALRKAWSGITDFTRFGDSEQNVEENHE